MQTLPTEIQQRIVIHVGALCLSTTATSYREKASIFIPWNRESQQLFRKDYVFAEIVSKAYQYRRAQQLKYRTRRPSNRWIDNSVTLLKYLPPHRLTLRVVELLFSYNLPGSFAEELTKRLLKCKLLPQYEFSVCKLINGSSGKSLKDIAKDLYVDITEHGNIEFYRSWCRLMEEHNISPEAASQELRPLVELAYLRHNFELARCFLPKVSDNLTGDRITTLLLMTIITGDGEGLKLLGDEIGLNLETTVPVCIHEFFTFDLELLRRYGYKDEMWGSFEIVKLMGGTALTIESKKYENVRNFSDVYSHLKSFGYEWDDKIIISRALSMIGSEDETDGQLLRLFPVETVWEAIISQNFHLYDAVKFLVTQGIFSINQIPLTKVHRAQMIRDADSDIFTDSSHWVWNLL